ncbi:MAG TPA: hypothetical protein VFL03_02105 [Candidatus Limnocylindrales bacterium]|jgi:hypothetical protein|nr:hypothetical protein [Candidatus Limnocylindrales bacterium]
MAIRRARLLLAAIVGAALVSSVPVASAASPPSNDNAAGAIPLVAGVPAVFNSLDATEAQSDPTSCDGSHGSFDGPYFASVWFSYRATNRDRHLVLNAPTMQGHPDDFLAISFVYAVGAGGSRTLVDCTAFGNDAEWDSVPGTTYLIMEAGLSSAVTEDPDFSDRGGHGTIRIDRLAPQDGKHYAWSDAFTYDDCGFRVEGEGWGNGMFTLKKGRNGDPTPYFFDNYESHFITRNPANGKWFREDGQGMYKDLRIVNVEGTIYTFQAIESGRPYTLTDQDGNRVYFDRGLLVRQFMVDTKGDDDLDNDEFIDGSFSILADRGDHPGFYIEDWCQEVVIPLLGD